ncbi:YdcF family protein [Fluviicola sp.]|uniref:YdcF family protein n=1 Tax=Fluviicola sp. TaxID=1917219 RepID=UPI0031D1A827
MSRIKIKHLIYLFLLWFGIHEFVTIADGLTDENSKADIAVIYGNTVNEDGTLSERLKARLDRGIELYRDSLADVLFVSGGLGKEGFYEGTKMQEYLIEKGIPAQKIVVDNQGNNTKQTTLNFIKKFGTEKSVVVVSQYHHISRAKLAFRKAGVENVTGAHVDYFEIRDFYACIREFFGYYAYLLTN